LNKYQVDIFIKRDWWRWFKFDEATYLAGFGTALAMNKESIHQGE